MMLADDPVPWYQNVNLLGAWGTIVAAFAALVALGTSIWFARRQLVLQQQQSDPYVWIDIRPDERTGQMLHLLLGNSGQTVATDVHATFVPPLILPADHGEVLEAAAQLINGLSSLPPGRTIAWSLGAGNVLLGHFAKAGYELTVKANGPRGPLDPLVYRIDVQQIAHSTISPPGTLNGVAMSVDKLTKEIKAGHGATRKQ